MGPCNRSFTIRGCEGRIREACRVLRPGAGVRCGIQCSKLYFFLYNTWLDCQRLREIGLTRLVVNRCLLLPLFALYLVAGRLIVHRRLAVPSSRQIVNYFADQMLNPVVTFHSKSEISEWAESAGVRIGLIAYSHGRSLINFEIRRDKQEIAL